MSSPESTPRRSSRRRGQEGGSPPDQNGDSTPVGPRTPRTPRSAASSKAAATPPPGRQSGRKPRRSLAEELPSPSPSQKRRRTDASPGSSDLLQPLPSSPPSGQAGEESLFSSPRVKYLREVTPYFRKASPLSDLGWGSQDSAQKDDIKSNWSEIKTIPLRLCYLCRNLTMADKEKRTLELHSPDGKGLCALRFGDELTCSDWFNAIHSNVMLLTQQAIAEANQIMSNTPSQQQVQHMGWLSEQLPAEDKGVGMTCWKPVFVALTEKDMVLYDTAPWTKEEWATPFQNHQLIATRLVHCNKQTNQLGEGDVLSFGTRSGTRNGVEVHIFRVETQRDLAFWSRALVQGSHGAVALTKEVACCVKWKDKKCRLLVHLETGFTLSEDEGDGVRGEQRPPPTILWQFPFEKLRMSADDGHRLLWLDFSDGSEQELDLGVCPKPIVFIIHTFLSAKVSRLGLIA